MSLQLAASSFHAQWVDELELLLQQGILSLVALLERR